MEKNTPTPPRVGDINAKTSRQNMCYNTQISLKTSKKVYSLDIINQVYIKVYT